MSQGVVLHSFFTSSCSWRVRAALQWKQIPFLERSVDIVKEKQHLTEQYREINPAQKVPALEIDGHILSESMAILQYLEETRPEKSLSPDTPLLRARMSEICETVVSGIQPLQNTGIRDQFHTDEDYQKFTQHHADRGLQTLETLLDRCAGDYCVGAALSMADLCFVPQVYNAETRLQLDISKYETVSRLYKKLCQEELFIKTHPRTIRPNKST